MTVEHRFLNNECCEIQLGAVEKIVVFIAQRKRLAKSIGGNDLYTRPESHHTVLVFSSNS